MRIAINGFGRIGRLALRRLAEFPGAEVVAINDLADPTALAYLFKYDSVHGRLDAPSRFDGGALVWGDRRIPITAEKDPMVAGWGRLGVDVVVEASGAFRKRENAARHLEAGAGRVVVTAPLPGADRTVVMGVNDHLINLETDKILSNASCTTNCLAPVASVLVEKYGIVTLAFTTVHAYTSSQSLVDTPMRKLRRGRAAALSMIPTSTGASEAIAEVIPALKGKVAGTAVRVPVPDGSLTDMVVRFERAPGGVAEVNAALRTASEGRLRGILEVSDDPHVSIDIVGNSHSAVVDTDQTMRVSADTYKLFAWYDNEWGYSCRVADLVLRLGA